MECTTGGADGMADTVWWPLVDCKLLQRVQLEQFRRDDLLYTGGSVAAVEFGACSQRNGTVPLLAGAFLNRPTRHLCL